MEWNGEILFVKIQLIFKLYSPVRLVWPNTEMLKYFSAVYVSIKDPIAAPGPYEPQVCQNFFGIVPAPTLFTTLAKRHS